MKRVSRLEALNAVLSEIRELGASLVVISPQLPSHSRELKAQPKLGFDLLFDEGNKVAETFGIAMRLPDDLIDVYRKGKVDLEAYNGDSLWTLPVPARIVADRDGVVPAVDADPDYTRRPEPSETIEVLRALKA